MFGRRAQQRAPSSEMAGALSTVHNELVPVADPDFPSQDRERALRGMTGRMMQGQAGYVVDYDRGDPVHSFERVLDRTALNRPPYAGLGLADQAIVTQGEIYDMGSADEELTAYQMSMLSRINRGR